eukprot:3532105-Amphidinium_carterae.1
MFGLREGWQERYVVSAFVHAGACAVDLIADRTCWLSMLVVLAVRCLIGKSRLHELMVFVLCSGGTCTAFGEVVTMGLMFIYRSEKEWQYTDNLPIKMVGHIKANHPLTTSPCEART